MTESLPASPADNLQTRVSAELDNTQIRLSPLPYNVCGYTQKIIDGTSTIGITGPDVQTIEFGTKAQVVRQDKEECLPGRLKEGDIIVTEGAIKLVNYNNERIVVVMSRQGKTEIAPKNLEILADQIGPYPNGKDHHRIPPIPRDTLKPNELTPHLLAQLGLGLSPNGNPTDRTILARLEFELKRGIISALGLSVPATKVTGNYQIQKPDTLGTITVTRAIKSRPNVLDHLQVSLITKPHRPIHLHVELIPEQ